MQDMIAKHNLKGDQVFVAADYYEKDPLYPEHAVEAALDRAEKAGIALVRDEIDRVIAAMKVAGTSDESSLPDVVGNLVGASHIERLRKQLFG